MRVMRSPTYSFRPATMEDGAAINALYCSITGCRRTIEHWHWLWHEAPGGPGSSWVIERDGPGTGGPRLVGHHGVLRLAGHADGEPVRLGKTENTMVAPEDRERFLYPRMEREMLGRYGSGFDGIFSFAGPSAALRMRTALGYVPGARVVTEIWCHGRLGRLSALGRCWLRNRLGVPHRLGSWDARRPRGADWRPDLDEAASAAIEALAESARNAPGVRIAKTPEFIRWRYLRHPSRCYSIARVAGACLVAHEFRRSILAIDEMLPHEVTDPGEDGAWRRISDFVLDSGYRAVRLTYSSAEPRHATPLMSCGWTQHRSGPAVRCDPEAAPRIWVNPRCPAGSRIPPSRWTLCAAASEGP